MIGISSKYSRYSQHSVATISEGLDHPSFEDDVILRIEGISKAFPGVLALNDVSIDIKKGEILAILGENGAGKSTLMKILSGLYQPDRGQILVRKSWFFQDQMEEEGEENSESEENLEQETLESINLSGPRDAITLGIGQVYQHFQLVGPFTVGENITLGQEFTQVGNFLIDNKKTNEVIEQLSIDFGLPIDPSVKVENLPIGLKQRVEILKQLFRKAELLILDEPTAVLTPTEVKGLFKTIEKLRAAGKSIIFISHKLKESLNIADRIVVLRKGEVVGETFPGKVSEKELAEMLVGRRLLKQLDRRDIPVGRPILEVINLDLLENYDQVVEEGEEDDERKYLLQNLNFTVFQNQIVGVVGVQGNGQSELLDCLVGMRRPSFGSIMFYQDLMAMELTNYDTLEILKSGIGYIPEDRTMQGLILEFTVTENSWLAFHGFGEDELAQFKELWENETEKDKTQSPFQKLLLPIDKMKKLAKQIVDDYEVKTPSISTTMRNLSGGNQQKVLIGREFAKDPELIIAAEPTRGVDVGVMEKVHHELIRRRDEGIGILLVSSDLDEILKLADYILVMYEGRIVGQGPIKEFDVAEISKLMTFGTSSEEESK